MFWEIAEYIFCVAHGSCYPIVSFMWRLDLYRNPLKRCRQQPKYASCFTFSAMLLTFFEANLFIKDLRNCKGLSYDLLALRYVDAPTQRRCTLRYQSRLVFPSAICQSYIPDAADCRMPDNSCHPAIGPAPVFTLLLSYDGKEGK